jgi:hypothetical protein
MRHEQAAETRRLLDETISLSGLPTQERLHLVNLVATLWDQPTMDDEPRRLLDETISLSGLPTQERLHLVNLVATLWDQLTMDDEPVFRAPLGAWSKKDAP